MELRQYLKVGLRWWWLVALSTVLAAATSYYVSSQQPRVYRTSTSILVGQAVQQVNPAWQDFYTAQQLAQSYTHIVNREPILQGVIDALGLETSPGVLKNQVASQYLEGTQIVEISVSDTSPERAKAIADEIANQLILQGPTSPRNAARHERGDFVGGQLDDLETRIEGAQARVRELEDELAQAFSARQIQDLQTEIANLERLIDGWQQNYSELLSFLEGTDSANYITVIESAALPSVPISPNVSMNVLLAAAVGMALAIGAVLLLEYIDDTVKSANDLSAVMEIPPLGTIGRLEGNDYKDKLISSTDLFSPLAEAYRMMRSNLQFMTVDRPTKSIMFTSPNPSEGKSTTAANLAVTMAQAELKTIIVDADLRRPTMHKLFGVPNLGGLSELFRSPDLAIESQLNQSEIDNLRVLTSGPLPPNPSEMLSSKRMAQLVDQLEEMADIVIFDTPPTLVVSDAVGLSSRVDGVIVVTLSGKTRRDEINLALQSLQRVGANILGGVLNQVPRKEGGYYYQEYHYAQGPHGRETQGQAFGSKSRWWRRLPFLNNKKYSAG